MKTRDEYLAQAVAIYGKDNQIRQTIEEMSELSVALCKYLRNPGENVLDVLQEAADVKIMLDQLLIIMGEENAYLYYQIEERKLARLINRIEPKAQNARAEP